MSAHPSAVGSRPCQVAELVRGTLVANVVVSVAAQEWPATHELPAGVIRVASAAELLAADPRDIDLVLVAPPAHSRVEFVELLQVLTARLGPAAVLLSATRPRWYVEFVRDPSRGFRTSLSPLGVLSVWIGPGRSAPARVLDS